MLIYPSLHASPALLPWDRLLPASQPASQPASPHNPHTPQAWWRTIDISRTPRPICMMLGAVWQFEGPYWRSIRRGGRVEAMRTIPLEV